MSILKIPSDTENSAAFRQRLAALIRTRSTHLYIDTSFLMWMTKVGSDSRRELIGWLQKSCAGRVHVPIWAAHEYLKHHVAGTITTELKEQTNEVSSRVHRAYTYFRPFLDEPLGQGAEAPSTIRAEARKTLGELDRLASKINKQWDYKKHASEVISFINEVTPEQTSVYDHLENITQVGDGRFTASIPPGYQDRRKKGRGQQSKEHKDEAPAGSNQYGDLIFWKEVLVHAKNVQAEALVVVTNDRKNDWYMGGSKEIDIDPELRSLKKDWKPVPRPHPMLAMEAKLVAEVGQVELLDSAYLAALLWEVAGDEVKAFVNVAIITDSSEPASASDRRVKLLEERTAADTAEASAAADEQGYLFPDSPLVQNSLPKFSLALFASRNVIDERDGALLEEWRANVGEGRPLAETITSEALAGFDRKKLVRLARELHDRVLQRTPGYEEALADLVLILDRLPPKTAAALYLGLLASMYLVRESNASRLPPFSPVARLLFDQQPAAYALNGVRAVAERLSDNEAAPLYLPNSDCPKISIRLNTEPHTSAVDQLRSLKVREVELLTPAQRDESFRLSALFGSTEPTAGEEIIRKACDLFAIPLKQVERENLFKQSYTLTETIGFKRPRDIKILKEVPGDD